MQTKQIILIVIIIAAISGAGIFLYLTFKGPGASSGGLNSPIATSPILPHGTDLNFDKVNKFNQTGHTFQYPTVNPGDAGSALNDIISQQQ